VKITRGGKTTKGASSAAQIRKLIGKSFETNEENIADGMSRAIAEMGISVPQHVAAVDPSDGAGGPASRLNTSDVILMTLLSNPNEWFLVLTAKSRRRDIGLYGLGDCFEMTTHREGGNVQHYVRYTGGRLNEKGKRKVERIRKKMGLIRSSVASGGVWLATSRPSRSRKGRTAKKGSLIHAAMYPLSAEEFTFLDKIIPNPNSEILVLSGTKNNEIWHSFRWKWQSRYGFDLSEIAVSQQKVGEKKFNIYVTYTPRNAGVMSDEMARFVNFLEQKRGKRGKKSVKTTPTPEATVIGWPAAAPSAAATAIIPIQ
jgi:hypothetical protein